MNSPQLPLYCNKNGHEPVIIPNIPLYYVSSQPLFSLKNLVFKAILNAENINPITVVTINADNF